MILMSTYIEKPYKIDEIRQIVGHALMKRRLRLENMELRQSLKKAQPVPFIVGKSNAIIGVLKTIQQISSSDTNVLILGESGTGKELAAKAIHHLSPRSENKFVAFNCGSFSDELMANELFGHEKGAFTGAMQEKSGLLQEAHRGTVFLDEIGDMPMSMQVLANHFLTQKSSAMKKEIDAIEPEAMDLLSRYSWPGNVRELENVIERAVALENGPLIRVTDLPDYICNLSIETYRHHPSDIPTLEEQERRYIQWVLNRNQGNKTRAAKIMGIDRVSLWRKLKRYRIE